MFAKFQVEIFRDYDFSGGDRISHFPIGLENSAALLTALPVTRSFADPKLCISNNKSTQIVQTSLLLRLIRFGSNPDPESGVRGSGVRIRMFSQISWELYCASLLL